jgi:tripartite-type tricarboxylate transporter receptor subunit TctC
MNTFRYSIAALILNASMLACAGSAWAQSYPDRPIRIIDPWAPGGGSGNQIRPLAAILSEQMGQQVVVESKPGANSIIGTQAVASSAPDGYTLLMGSKTIASNASFYRNVPYDAATALTPITMVSKVPFFIVANGSIPANSLKEFIALAKSKPGAFNLASSGTGGAPHLAGQFFSMEAGISLTHVPYKGVGPATFDLLAGNVHILFTGLASVGKHVETGKLKLLAFAGLRRSPAAPNIPTADESGLPGFEGSVWYGLFGPAGLPAPIAERIANEVRTALQRESIKELFGKFGAEPNPMTPKVFAEVFRRELVLQAEVIKAAGIKEDL